MVQDTIPLTRKGKYICFRIFENEAKILDDLAKSEKMDRSKFIRSRIFSPKNKDAA